MNIVRQAVERLYTGIMTVTEYKSVKNSATKITSKQEQDVLTDIPCRLSFTSSNSAELQGGVSTRRQTVKLFCAPEFIIAPGSKITVTQNGRTTSYKQSGEAAVYTSHQEITLELFERWT